MDLPLASIQETWTEQEPGHGWFRRGFSCVTGGAVWWHLSNPLFSLFPQNMGVTKTSSLWGRQKSRDILSHTDWTDRSLLPHFSCGYNARKTFWRPKMSTMHRISPPPPGYLGTFYEKKMSAYYGRHWSSEAGRFWIRGLESSESFKIIFLPSPTADLIECSQATLLFTIFHSFDAKILKPVICFVILSSIIVGGGLYIHHLIVNILEYKNIRFLHSYYE